jgi:ketosteroid isomerase-like protein
MIQTGEASQQDMARRAVVQVMYELADGDARAASARCAPDARWWLPFDWAAELRGPDACARLAGLFAAATSVRVETVVVSPGGERAVVEVSAIPHVAIGRTAATSVLRLQGGLITDGRTYLDVAAWAGDVA